MYNKSSFVITSIASWGTQPKSCAQQLAREISQRHNVLFVNPPADLKTLLGSRTGIDIEQKSRVLRGGESAIRRLGPNLWVLTPPIIVSTGARINSDFIFDAINRRNNRRLAEVIRWAASTIGIRESHLVINNDIFRSFYLDEHLPIEQVFYYRTGSFASLPYWRYHSSRLEPALVRKCDAVITSNEPLADEVRPFNPNTFNIGQGVECPASSLSASGRLRPPRDMQGIRRPIVGFTGTLGGAHYSPQMFCLIAQALPECSFVLVGNEDREFLHHRLHSLPNVYFLEGKCVSDIPLYISFFDVVINPELSNRLTETCFPNKIAQYLSLGKRVVAARTGPMAQFMHHVALADGLEEYVTQIRLALSSPVTPVEQLARNEFLSSLSWETCADRFYSVLDYLHSQGDRETEYENNVREELLYS